MRNLLRYAMSALGVALLSLGITSCEAIVEELPTYEETSLICEKDDAPDFKVTTIEGETFTLSEHRGEVVLVVFFSHTCPDCKSLFDDLNKQTTEIEDLDVSFIAISRGGTEQEIKDYIATNGYTFDVAVDENRVVYNRYATMYVPRTYLIDKDGVVSMATIEYDVNHAPELLERMRELNGVHNGY